MKKILLLYLTVARPHLENYFKIYFEAWSLDCQIVHREHSVGSQKLKIWNLLGQIEWAVKWEMLIWGIRNSEYLTIFKYTKGWCNPLSTFAMPKRVRNIWCPKRTGYEALEVLVNLHLCMFNKWWNKYWYSECEDGLDLWFPAILDIWFAAAWAST